MTDARSAAATGLISRRLAQPATRLAVGALAAAMAFASVYAGFVLTEAGQRLENAALLGAGLRTEAERAGSLAQLSAISIGSFAVAVLLVATVAFLRERAPIALVAALVMGGSAIGAELLEAILPRPALVEGPTWLLRNTFPSGHATVATAIGVGALLVAPDRVRWAILPVAAVYAAAVGYAVQVAGWHRLSGILGGTALVMTVAMVALLILARTGRAGPSQRVAGHPRVRGALLVVAAILIGGAAMILGLAVAVPLLVAPRLSEAAFLHAAFSLLGGGVTVLAFLGFGWAIQPLGLGRPST